MRRMARYSTGRRVRRARWWDPDRLADRAVQYSQLMRLHRPIGALLLLWPALWALWIAAEGPPDALILAVFLLGVVVMRSAGCVINDYADRDYDPHVERCRDRPLAAGRVTAREALGLFVVLCLVALGLVLLLNRLTVLLAIPGAILTASYPFMKRFTYLPQIHLGVAFGWAVPMAFAAQTGAVPQVAWLLLVGVVLWAVVYDTMYAMVDRDDDLRIGLKSTAILFGELDRLIVGIVQSGVLVVLVLVGHQLELGSWYHGGVAVAALLGVWQQLLIRTRERDGCFRAFLNNNWSGAAIFAGLAAEYGF